jgi:hypothetical protein
MMMWVGEEAYGLRWLLIYFSLWIVAEHYYLRANHVGSPLNMKNCRISVTGVVKFFMVRRDVQCGSPYGTLILRVRRVGVPSF